MLSDQSFVWDSLKGVGMTGESLKSGVDIDAIAQQVIEDARQSAVVIGRFSPFFHVPRESSLEERTAPEEDLDVEYINRIKDIPFQPEGDPEHIVVGIDGSQRYCGAIADGEGIIGAVRAAITATSKTAEHRFQIESSHCISLGPYLLPFLYRNNQYLELYNTLLTGLFSGYGVNPISTISTSHLIDRTRNLIEKFAQIKAIQRIRNAIIVFDGATTLQTVDTPKAIWDAILEAAERNNNTIVGVSKNSSLRVGDKFLLDTIPPFPSGRRLKDCHEGLTSSMQQRIAGRVFAARFTEFGRVFRFDTIPPTNRNLAETHYEVARSFLTNDLFSRSSGYPNSVALADMQCNLLGSGTERMLRARAMQDFGVKMESRVSIMKNLRRFSSYVVHRRRF